MFSLDKFLIISGDQKNVYIRSDDGTQNYTISVFNINVAFVSGNLVRIKQLGTDQIITIPFRNVVEANSALKKLQSQIDVIRTKTPFILEKGMQNYVDGKFVSDLSPIYATLSVYQDNFDDIYGTISNIYGTLSQIEETIITQNYFAGIVSGATGWVNNGDGTMTLPNLQVALFNNNSWIPPLSLFNVLGGTTGVDFPALSNEDTNYIYIDYNGGGPVYVINTSDGAINDSDVIRYLTIYRSNNFLHILEYGDEGLGLPNKINNRIIGTERIARESGLQLGLSGSSGIVTLSEGVVWNASNRVIVDGLNSNDDIFFTNYHIGGSWTYSTLNNTLNNTYYDDGTDLVIASVSKFLTNWYYRGLEVNDHLYEVVSNAQYDNVSEAQLSKVPILPELITSHAFLVGRIIVEVGSQSGFVESAFQTYFQPSNVTSHSDLNNLQGGGPGEYYHLSFNEYDNLAYQNVDNNFTTNQTVDGYLSASTFYGDGSNLTGIFDTKVNNLEYVNPILTLSQNDGSSYSVSISTSDSYVTGLSFSGGVLSLGQTGVGQTFTASIPDIIEDFYFVATESTIYLVSGGTTFSANLNLFNYDRLFDYTGTYSYSGTAPQGTSITTSLWDITRIEYFGSGTGSISTSTQSVAWVDRYIITYV